MKKNLRRIMLLLLAIITLCKNIYATEGSKSVFSGYMKFVFIGVAVILLAIILFLSYKLDKEEPVVGNEGTVSKKKLGNKSRNKTSRKKDDLYSSFSDTNDDEYESTDEEYYETDLNQNEFDSEEEEETFEEYEEDDSEENLYQEIDSLDDEYEIIEEDDEDDYATEMSGYDENEYEVIDEDENDELDFDDSVLEDLDDYEDPKPKKVTKNIIEDEDTENLDFDFDTSVLDDLDDYESPTQAKKVESSKPLSNTNLEPKTNKRFTSSANNSGIGFRNSSTNTNSGIGFRNSSTNTNSEIGFRNNSTNTNSEIGFKKEKTSTNSSIGFERKTKKTENFDSEDFLSQMEENLKSARPTATRTRKTTNSEDITTKTTSRRKKTE